MERQYISDTFYYVDTKDLSGRLIRTVVFKLQNGIYKAFTSYFPNETQNNVGYATSHIDFQAIILSIKNFEKELKLEKKRISTI
ncbi:hypothetical protein [Neobacillus niacini]|uniref:hypothetical protein n=1 Tax=Neobacillus niacini TaxID=86668 RepID=UPI0007AB587F|nr:hypothetical protein [Neobacillus niacini]